MSFAPPPSPSETALRCGAQLSNSRCQLASVDSARTRASAAASAWRGARRRRRRSGSSSPAPLVGEDDVAVARARPPQPVEPDRAGTGRARGFSPPPTYSALRLERLQPPPPPPPPPPPRRRRLRAARARLTSVAAAAARPRRDLAPTLHRARAQPFAARERRGAEAAQRVARLPAELSTEAVADLRAPTRRRRAQSAAERRRRRRPPATAARARAAIQRVRRPCRASTTTCALAERVAAAHGARRRDLALPQALRSFASGRTSSGSHSSCVCRAGESRSHRESTPERRRERVHAARARGRR